MQKKETKRLTREEHKKRQKKVAAKKEVPKKKVRISYRKVLKALIILIIIIVAILIILNMKIRNIVVKNNSYLSDQEIIDIAGIRNYPNTALEFSWKIEKRLNDNPYIRSVKVSKSDFSRKVTITVEENLPLFYYNREDMVVLQDGTRVSNDDKLPILVNQVPEDVLNRLIKKMKDIPRDVLDKISEMKYAPTNVDQELFLFTMNDGIYVYVTLSKFERIYNYLEYAEGFDKKKGILYLDSGDYLQILEG